MPYIMREKQAPREPKGPGVPGQAEPACDGLPPGSGVTWSGVVRGQVLH